MKYKINDKIKIFNYKNIKLNPLLINKKNTNKK